MKSARKRRVAAWRAPALLEVLEDRCLLSAIPPGSEFVKDELLIQFRPGVTEQQQIAVRRLAGGALLERIQTSVMKVTGGGPLERLRLASGVTVERAMQALRSSSLVQFAEPNWIVRTTAVSNDPRYTDGSRLWGMYGDDVPLAAGPGGTTNPFGSQAEKAWDDGQIGSSDVFVGVVDEGIQTTHPDLQDNIWVNPWDPVDGLDNDGNGYVDDVHGWDFVNNDNSVYDAGQDSHGTHVAGTLGGQGGNGLGVAGVSWDVTIIATKFLGRNGGTVANAIRAIDYLTDLKKRHGINLVASNNSWGGSSYSQGLHDAIIRSARAEILFVAAAGNNKSNNNSRAFYPANYSTTRRTSTQAAASYESVISVAALTDTGALASYSNYGSTTVDIAAPGSLIWSSVPSGNYGLYSGTSMAAPHVTGTIALAAAARPGSTANALRNAILNSAVPTSSVKGKTVTGGRLNAWAAVQHLTRGVQVTMISDSTSESGGTTTITVQLTSRPVADVTIPIRSSDLTEGRTDVSSVTLTRANWNVPQTVTVSGVDDHMADGDVAWQLILGAAVSDDPNYSGFDAADVALVNRDDDPLVTKFYVVNDGTPDRTYEYGDVGQPMESYALAAGNTAPRGAASRAAGDRVWVVDRNRRVYVYDSQGGLLGSWLAGTMASSALVEGIATNGTDVWIVDSRTDRVYFYRNAAARTSETQTAESSFLLNAANRNPKGIVTDGVHLWLVNDSTTDKIFQYTLSGSLVSSWTIDAANKLPTDLTLDPSNTVADLWVVDSGTDRVYQYADGRNALNGSRRTATASFALAAGNTNPQGIADPPSVRSASLQSSARSLPAANVMSPAVPVRHASGGAVFSAISSAGTLFRRLMPTVAGHRTAAVPLRQTALELSLLDQVLQERYPGGW